MDSPDSDTLSEAHPEDANQTRNNTTVTPQSPSNPQSRNGTFNEHFKAPKGFHLFSIKSRKSTLQANRNWEQPADHRYPYHQYVHDLVQGGWDILRTLEEYMSVDIEDSQLVVSILDITDNFQSRRWPDIHDGAVLKNFMDSDNRSGVKVRLYLAEQEGDMAAGVMEVLGSSLNLDPRFFQWSLKGSRRLLAPSDLHKAPYISLGFGIPGSETLDKACVDRFKVTVYILPGENGTWTGIVLFNSHTKITHSSLNLKPPPLFNDPRPPPTRLSADSLREKYLETFAFIDLAQATISPFYAVSYLFRMNCLFWTRVISTIREEDRRVNGISDTTIGHVEEIQKALRCLQRGGSTSWPGGDTRQSVEARLALEEDFRHLIQETDLMWQARDKMASIKEHQRETKWTTLTNTFTYVFAPVTIISGIYGMNVSEISGSSSNPDIWQFFVAVIALNFAVLLTLAASNWVHIVQNHGRKAGAKEVLGFAVGKVDHLFKAA